MILIKHRVNKIKDLKKLDKEFGVEIDIRSKGKEYISIMTHTKKEKVFQ